MGLPERRGENCTDVIYGVIENDLGIDPENIQFHAVQHVGKPREVEDSTPRPIIVPFLCREDRDTIYSADNRLKNSSKFQMRTSLKTTLEQYIWRGRCLKKRRAFLAKKELMQKLLIED